MSTEAASETTPLVQQRSRQSLQSTQTTQSTQSHSYLIDQLPPLSKRITQVTCAIIWCLFAAGPVFGFAAFKPVLIAEGVYADKCPHITITDNNKGNTDGDICVERDLKLNLMFTLAAVITNATALLVGGILDHFGPRTTGIIGSVILFIASLLMSHGKDIVMFDAYLAGYIAVNISFVDR
ncbi:unnamed protein product [Ambrosiozyma monospora]|uniref:Unnamed protein product n=1 Tax=Ambrosiozyma monospora TaxID=43982 RepID=A0ACB5T2W3_AMBMO|nr:unnamed protein product [Ambrosiozyma monospora]